MIDWIFGSDKYTELYHQYFGEFMNTVDVQSIISNAKTLIAPYVEKDPTKFCTYAEFETGVETLAAFCDLRSQSVAQQLAGEEATVDASSINLSAMGTMGGGFGGKGQRPGMSEENRKDENNSDNTSDRNNQTPQMPGGQMPGQFGGFGNTTNTDGSGSGNQQFPNFGGQGGMTPPDGMEIPEGMENMFPGQGGNGFPNRGQSSNDSAQGNSFGLLIATFAILVAGLLFVFKFKR